MDGQAANGKNKFAHLDRLSTESLEELLRADIESPDNDEDEAVLHILEVIEQREKKQPTRRLSDVDKAWDDFQKYYNTPEGEGLSLYSEDVCEKVQTDFHIVKKAKKAKVRRHSLRRALAAAIIAACLIVFAVPPAFGYQNFIHMVGQWTADVFHFGPDPSTAPPNAEVSNSEKYTGEYESLQAALDECGITEPVVPTKITDGFQLVRVTVEESPEFYTTNLNAYYENDIDKSISISIVKWDSQESYSYEKDETNVIPYVVGETTHYIFENNNRTVATWYVGTLECSIKADVPLAEMEKMIDSIYER